MVAEAEGAVTSEEAGQHLHVPGFDHQGRRHRHQHDEPERMAASEVDHRAIVGERRQRVSQESVGNEIEEPSPLGTEFGTDQHEKRDSEHAGRKHPCLPAGRRQGTAASGE